jgi:hypothetical protein
MSIFKKYIFVFALVFLTACSADLGSDKTSLAEWEKADSPLKLQVDKEKILTAEEYEAVKYDERTDELISSETITRYYYVAEKLDKEVLELKGETYTEAKRTENAVIWEIGKDKEGKELFYGRFYPGQQFYQDSATKEWYQIRSATTTPEAYQEQTKESAVKVLFNKIIGRAYADDTIKPVSQVGFIAGANNATWSTVHGATTGTKSNNVDNIFVGILKDSSSRFTIRRGYFVFNTSAVSGTIQSASLNFYRVETQRIENTDGYGYEYINIVSFSPADSSSVANDDYNDFGTTKLSQDYAIADIRDNEEPLTFTLNATGIAAINKGGATSLGARIGYDTLNQAPTLAASKGVRAYFQDYNNDAKDPYLLIVYSAPATPTVAPTANIIYFE